jgi:hypothetical protein
MTAAKRKDERPPEPLYRWPYSPECALTPQEVALLIIDLAQWLAANGWKGAADDRR